MCFSIFEKDNIVQRIQQKIRTEFISDETGKKIQFGTPITNHELFPTNTKIFNDYYIKFDKKTDSFVINNAIDFQNQQS